MKRASYPAIGKAGPYTTHSAGRCAVVYPTWIDEVSPAEVRRLYREIAALLNVECARQKKARKGKKT